jgi:hypothetical protein
MTAPMAQEQSGRLYLVEWWSHEAEGLDRAGSWQEFPDGFHARTGALTVVDLAWTLRVRITILQSGATVGAVNANRATLDVWEPGIESLPSAVEGPPLPPRSADDLRGEVVCSCRDALALALRARLLSRDRVAHLLHEIDRSFDPGCAEDT